MATRNIVPRANNEGQLGTVSKYWANIYSTLATITTATISAINGNPTFGAGSASASAVTFTAGTVKSTASAGGIEYDGKVFYTTPVASARGVSPSTMFAIVPAGDFNLSTTSGVQAAFPTTNDVWTLAANTTYLVEGHYQITKTTTSVTVALAFAAGGSLTITSMLLFVEAMNVAANTTTATVAMTAINQLASTVVNATATTECSIKFKGLIRTNAAGTLTPQVNWSANTTAPVMKANSYICFTPLGTDTTNAIGNVA